MYALGLMVLLGLAVLAVTAIAARYVATAAEIRAFVLAGLGVGAAWLVNLDLFGVLGVVPRDSAIGVTVTGLMIGGAAYFWQEILGFFAFSWSLWQLSPGLPDAAEVTAPSCKSA